MSLKSNIIGLDLLPEKIVQARLAPHEHLRALA